MLKKCLKIIAICVYIIIFSLVLNLNGVVFADEQPVNDDLNQNIQEQLQEIDFSFLDDAIYQMQEDSKEIFNSDSFQNKVNSIIDGNFDFNFNDIVNIVIKLLFDNITKILPIIAIIIALSILFGVLGGLTAKEGSSVKDIIHFLVYGVIIIVISTLVMSCIGVVNQSFSNIKSQMDAIFPIMLMLLTAVGATSSLSVLQPLLVVVTNFIFDLFTFFLIPLFFISFIFTIANNINQNDYFSKFLDFFYSVFKWSIGVIFTIFSFCLTIAGIVCASHDGLSIKMTKYAFKNSIPYIGSYMSDGVDIFLASSVLIKNAIGVCGLILFVCTILIPFIKLVVVNLSLKLTGAILQPITDKRISNFVTSVSKCISLLIVCIISCAIIYFLSVGILITICNSI